ncbi:VOC family protein [Oscillospiraceae bacterium OttesenSCG-928-G22]|nr:VOC family protein [Oscillospiraceae bacterium OttesenSCG-928-G22]
MSEEKKARPTVRIAHIVVDCAEAGPVAECYSKLLGWEWTHPANNGWAAITSPDGMVMAFQEVEGYTPPVWPWETGKQAPMLHLDLMVDDLDEGVAFALSCGARLADEQYFRTSRTMFDPAGHPFCIDTDEPE